ncbi:MAG: helix-turn-helix domain-containing protein [Thermoplasmata archaeon]|nr:helix-turn-helix domain-containing protein [Thermoplasmata archaeon]
MEPKQKNALTIDDFLMVVHNPLRRKILSRIVQGRCYTLQLARELGTTQQAVMKHIKILERYGIVECVEEESHEGPKRKCYFPTRSFVLWISLQPNLFDEVYFVPGMDENEVLDKHRKYLKQIDQIAKEEGEKSLQQLRKLIRELQEEMKKLQEEEKSLVFLLNTAMEIGKNKIMKLHEKERRKMILISLYSSANGDDEDDEIYEV